MFVVCGLVFWYLVFFLPRFFAVCIYVFSVWACEYFAYLWIFCGCVVCTFVRYALSVLGIAFSVLYLMAGFLHDVLCVSAFSLFFIVSLSGLFKSPKIMALAPSFLHASEHAVSFSPLSTL